MLDAISDFWKPSRKGSSDSKPDISALKIGSSVGFGFMPQTLLSGKRRNVVAINTYQFGNEMLTSYVLSEGDDKSVSLIVADSGTEPYIAISRRLQFAERMRMFENAEILALVESAEQKRLNLRDVDNEWRQWLVPQYKKEIHKLKGRFISGDYRSFSTIPSDADSRDFTYFLFASNNNEFAVEIEMYEDNRIELYATIYRRITDIGEIREANVAETTFSGALPKLAEETPQPKLVADAPKEPEKEPVKSEIQPLFPDKEEIKINEPIVNDPVVKETVVSTPLKVEALDESKKVEPEKPVVAQPAATNVFSMVNQKPVMDKIFTPFMPTQQPTKNEKKEPVKEELKKEETKQFEPKKENIQSEPKSTTKEKEPMTFATFNPQPANAMMKQDGAALNGHPKEYENDTIECELRAANKIIEEAIRNEMRMSDVIRRVIGLPLAGQESVQIPVLLSEDDYKLLAIRYGISLTDKSAIKTRIIEEVNDFSGAKRS